MSIRKALSLSLPLLAVLGCYDGARAQLTGVTYIHTDTITVGTTGVDSTFKYQWEEVTFWSRDGDLEFKAATKPDTVSWASRDYIRVTEGQMISFGPATKLWRWQGKAVADSVVVYFVGLKKVKRYQ